MNGIPALGNANYLFVCAKPTSGNISSLDVLNELFETEASVNCAVFATVVSVMMPPNPKAPP